GCLLEMVTDELIRLALGVEPVGKPLVELSARLLGKRRVGHLAHENVVKRQAAPQRSQESLLLQDREQVEVASELVAGRAFEGPPDGCCPRQGARVVGRE